MKLYLAFITLLLTSCSSQYTENVALRKDFSGNGHQVTVILEPKEPPIKKKITPFQWDQHQ